MESRDLRGWMNEAEGLGELKRIDDETKICFFTAFEVHPEEFGRLFPELDAYGFIKKPVTTAELAATIYEVIDKLDRERFAQ